MSTKEKPLHGGGLSPVVVGELHTPVACASNDNYKTIMIAIYATLIFDIQ